MNQESSPGYHIEKMSGELEKVIAHLREDIDKVDEPQFKAMFETSAEILGGIVKAFQDYQAKNESAWHP